ncbi:MAG: PH domain-containing protein [Candidatus Moraniibacteriota bacterium]
MRKFTEFHFKGQKINEAILLVVHRHWFDILIQFLIIFMMAILLIGSIFFAPIFLPGFEEAFGMGLFYFLQNSFFAFTWMLFFIIWIDYYFDVWIVTNERIVNIEQKGLFSRGVSELELENIQDITVEVKGIIPTFLNYGNLYVQTAAEKERFVFRNVPDPYAIKDLVMSLQKSYEKKEARNLGTMIRKEIHDELT